MQNIVYQDDLGYTFKVSVREDSTARWRKKTYKSLAHARRAIRNWAEGSLNRIG